MTSDAGIITVPSPPYTSSPSHIVVGNGNLLPVTSTGVTSFPHNLRLNNVLVSPGLIKNLVSVRQFTSDNNCSVEFDSLGPSQMVRAPLYLLHLPTLRPSVPSLLLLPPPFGLIYQSIMHDIPML